VYKKDKVSADDDIREMTAYGNELYSAYRMRQLEKPFNKTKTKK